MNGITAKYGTTGATVAKNALLIRAIRSMNVLWMRSVPCDSPMTAFNASSSFQQNVQKSSLTGIFNSFAQFPTNFAGSAANCFCVQQTIQDKSMFDFGVSLASQVYDLGVRDCSTVDGVATDSSQEISVTDLAQPIKLLIGVPSGVDLTNKKVTCAYIDKTTNKPSSKGVSTSFDKTTRVATCSASHLTQFVLLLGDDTTNASPSSTTSSSTSTSTATQTGSSDDNGGLGTGAIVGIAIGCAVVVIGVIGAVVYKMKKS